MDEEKYEKFKNYDPHYNKLVGKTFQGIYEGDHTMYSTAWKKVRYDWQTSKDEDLNYILREFEGKIWKGIHDGCFYVYPETVPPDLLDKDTEKTYIIADYKRFDFSDEPKTGNTYTDKCGYYFILTAETSQKHN